MITKVKMKNVACYKETILNIDKKIGLLYGLNGTGKSTLSNFLYDAENEKYKDCEMEGILEDEQILVYNQKFVEDNFGIISGDIPGIFTLTKENVKAKKIIAEAREHIKKINFDIVEIGRTESTLNQEFEKKQNKAYRSVFEIKQIYAGSEFDYCLSGLKGSGRTMFEYIGEIEKSTSPLEYTINDLKRQLALLDIQQEAIKMVPLIMNTCGTYEHERILLKKISGGGNDSFSSFIDELGNSSWVADGLKYVGEENCKCPFCQQTIGSEIIDKIRNKYNESYKEELLKVEEVLAVYKSCIIEEMKLISTIPEIVPLEKKELLKNAILKYNRIIENDIKSIEEKLRNPILAVSLTSDGKGDALNEANKIIAEINEIIDLHNNKITNRSKELEKINEKFWILMRDQYNHDVESITLANKELRSDLNKLSKQKSDLGKEKIEKESIIVKQQKSTVNIDEAVKNINETLLDIGIQEFSIAKYSEEEATYHLIRNDIGDVNVFKTLSEGEKMVISFLYFIELCKGDNKSVNTSSDKIVVIDDPISSLSHVHVFNIGRLIHNEFLRTEKYNQVIVLTHSLYFFYELTNINHVQREANQQLVRIKKNNDGSHFLSMKYEEIQNDYQAYWSIIKDSESSPALIANCMRNVIEYFFNFVEKQDFNNVFDKSEMQVNRFAAFNRYMNRESHSKGQNIFDIKEFDYDLFKAAFKMLFHVLGYDEHYEKMMK